MKAILKLSTLVIFSLILALPSFAQLDVDYDAADGIAAEVTPQTIEELKATVDEKQQKAVLLITEVASLANSYSPETPEYDEANYAYTGSVARLEGIRQERDGLAQNSIDTNEATLMDYSKRLDQINTDLENFFR
jgi:hypothetical protein